MRNSSRSGVSSSGSEVGQRTAPLNENPPPAPRKGLGVNASCELAWSQSAPDQAVLVTSDDRVSAGRGLNATPAPSVRGHRTGPVWLRMLAERLVETEVDLCPGTKGSNVVLWSKD